MKKKNSGIALMIVTILLCLILGLVLGIVALNQSGAKHSHFFKDREIALTLAKAGVADALYRMNYKDYLIGDYPSDTTPLTDSTFWISESNPFNDSNYDGSYDVDFTDSGTINGDTITSKGTYNGKIRKISVKIRGTNVAGSRYYEKTYGIAEAFNKHVIYADTVIIPDTVANDAIEGNICYNSESGSLTDNRSSATKCTTTGVDDNDFDPDSDGVGTVATVLTLDTDPSVWGIDISGLTPTEFADLGVDGDVTAGGITASYVVATDTYTFTGQTINIDIIVRGIVEISGGTVSKTVIADDDAASSDLTCTNAILSSGCTLYAEDNGTITLTYNADADTDVYTNGSVTVNSNANDTLTGNILGGSSITIRGNIINGSVVSAGNITLNNAVSTITPANNNGAIMTSGGKITIEDYSHSITGLVYANGDIDLNGGAITTGCVVSQGTVTLSNTPTIKYKPTTDLTNYETYPSSTTYNRVYANFTGGRRIYLPVIDSWEEE